MYDVKIALKAITVAVTLVAGAFLLACGFVVPEYGVGMALTGICAVGLGLLIGR